MISDREVDLYAHWEHSAGRVVVGPEGRYRIIHQGKRNGGPGPDYMGATVAFPDGSVRQGDVEIHLKGQDWSRHGHRWDPRYSDVMIHVVATGSLEAVIQNEWRMIPTIPCPRDGDLSQPPCETAPSSLRHFRAYAEFLRTLATQRWWRRIAEWRDYDKWGVLRALSRRIGPGQYRTDLVRIWHNMILEEADLFAFLKAVLDRLSFDRAGAIRREVPGRTAALSMFAFRYLSSPESIMKWSLEDVDQAFRDLMREDFPVPTRSFLIEVTGNWLLPLSEVEGKRDRLEEWYHLPLGWTYSRVKQQINRLGLPKPTTYGEQQGLLEWVESLCQMTACDYCPVAGASSDF